MVMVNDVSILALTLHPGRRQVKPAVTPDLGG
jgi:hypothetical protein